MRHPVSTIAVLLALAGPLSAAELDVPLTIPAEHVRDRVATALGLDGTGRAVLEHDACNRVEVADLALTTLDDALRVSVALQARAGTSIFGDCMGPGSWDGRMRVRLVPSVAPGGLAVKLTPESAELRRPDGSSGLLTRPARLLAENLVLPRLGNARIDLSEPMAELDRTLDALVPADRRGFILESLSLGGIEIADNSVRAILSVSVSPRQSAPAAEEAPLSESELAQWQRVEDALDGFLTAVITDLAARAGDRDLRIELLGVLLDSRMAIAESLASEEDPGRDRVRELFVDSWDRLRPHAEALARSDALPGAEGLRLSGFMAGADAIRAVDALGPGYGIEVSRDGLRRLARLLLAEGAPEALTPLPLGVDEDLRRLFDLDAKTAPPASHRPWLSWLVPEAHAQATPGSPAEALKGVVPRLAGLDEYLGLVAALLEQRTRARVNAGTRVPAEYRDVLVPLVRATAWKETCWRHYVGTGSETSVIRSAVGAVGMMQINGRVWRGLYEIERLEADIGYNVNAGIEILEHYLVDYAIRKGEHELEGGIDNLVRATYAAYNGGPSHLSRYRRHDTPTRLKAIDRAFWDHYRHISDEGWPEVGSCYPV